MLLSYINFTCAFVYAYLAVYILLKNHRSWLNRSCAFLVFSLAVWSLASTFVHSVLFSKEMVFRAVCLQVIGWGVFSYAYLWFVLCLVNSKVRNNFWFHFFSIVACIFVIHLQWKRQIIVDFLPAYFGWSPVWSLSFPGAWFYIIYTAGAGIAFFTLLRQGIRTTDVSRRTQFLSIAISTIVPVLLGTITNIILPVSGFRVIPDIAEILAMIWAMVIVYDISKYRFMTITAAMAADNIIANMVEGLLISDNTGKIVTVNNALCHLLGYSKDDMQGKDISLFIDIERCAVNGQQETVYGKSCECMLSAKDGVLVPVLLSVSPLRSDDGLIKGIVCIATDIRARKKEEDVLRLSHNELEKRVEERTAQLRSVGDGLAQESERLRVTLQSIADAVIVTDINGAIVLMNNASQVLTKYIDGQERLIYEVFTVIDRRSRGAIDNPVKLVLVKNQPSNIPDGAVLIAKDGYEVEISGSAAPIRDNDGRLLGAVLVFRDITDKRRIEEEMLKGLKLESLGVLSAGIAHDFNNILTGILTNISFAKTLVDKEHPQYQLLVDAEYASLRAKDLTHQLLTFAKGGAPVKKLSSIEGILSDTSNFILSGSSCKLTLNIAPGLWNAEIDAGQISQVLQNLLLNAMQAMPQGGMITIDALNVELYSSNRLLLDQGKYIKIVVSDTGVGIDAKNLPNIFDPYFTTKVKGTGLGLATTYSIIRRHKGHISVSSVVGKGSVFTIYIPATDKPLEKSHTQRVSPVGNISGRILVMDDEEIILNTAKNALATIGCDVEFALNGKEAVDKYAKALAAGKRFDAVILDLVIPGGMGGRETVAELLKIDPNVKAIVSSGYSNDQVMADFAKYGFKGIIPKPYTIQEFLQAVYNVCKG